MYSDTEVRYWTWETVFIDGLVPRWLPCILKMSWKIWQYKNFASEQNYNTWSWHKIEHLSVLQKAGPSTHFEFNLGFMVALKCVNTKWINTGSGSHNVQYLFWRMLSVPNIFGQQSPALHMSLHLDSSVTLISGTSYHRKVTQVSFSGTLGWGDQGGHKSDNKTLSQMSHPNRASWWVYMGPIATYFQDLKTNIKI